MIGWAAMWRRLQTVVGYALTTTHTDESGPAATVQLRPDNLRLIDNVTVAQHFGFQSSLPVGSIVVRLSVAGDSGNSIAVASGYPAARATDLPPGASRLHDQAGNEHRAGNDGTLQSTAAAHLRITAPGVMTSGNGMIGTGASGSFTSPTGQIITVRDGIIVNIY